MTMVGGALEGSNFQRTLKLYLVSSRRTSPVRKVTGLVKELFELTRLLVTATAAWMYWETPMVDLDIDADNNCTMSAVTELPAESKAKAESEASIDQVEPNVIDTGLNQEPPSSLPTQLSLLSAPSSSSRPMPSIDHLSFHSPSSEIIGTPFDTNSSPFEYPFPETSDSDSSSSPQLVSPAFASLASGASASRLTALLPSLPAPILHHSTSHPKMLVTNPPVPPSLLKKGHRWSLSIKGRRKNTPTVVITQQQQPPSTTPERCGSFEATRRQILTPSSHPPSPPVG